MYVIYWFNRLSQFLKQLQFLSKLRGLFRKMLPSNEVVLEAHF